MKNFNKVLALFVISLGAGTGLVAKDTKTTDKKQFVDIYYNPCVDAATNLIDQRNKFFREYKRQKRQLESLLAKLNAIFPGQAGNSEQLLQKIQELDTGLQNVVVASGQEQVQQGKPAADIIEQVNNVLAQIKESNELMNSLNSIIPQDLDKDKQTLQERIKVLIESHGVTMQDKTQLEEQLDQFIGLLAAKDEEIAAKLEHLVQAEERLAQSAHSIRKKDMQLRKMLKKIKGTEKRLKNSEENLKILEYYFGILTKLLQENCTLSETEDVPNTGTEDSPANFEGAVSDVV